MQVVVLARVIGSRMIPERKWITLMEAHENFDRALRLRGRTSGTCEIDGITLTLL
jgi:hypothetical protein